MAKIAMLCPFNQKLCSECPLYRGRHYYLCFCEKYRGCIGKPERNINPVANHPSVDFKALEKLIKRWEGRPIDAPPTVRLKVINMETEERRVCELEEAKTWDWDNPKMIRVVSGFHVTSWEKLVELASFKAKKGYQEVEVYEGPRFMMLAGG